MRLWKSRCSRTSPLHRRHAECARIDVWPEMTLLAFPLDLAERIENWDDRFQVTFKDDDPAESGFASQEEEQAYMEEGRAVARELAEAWPGKVDIEDRFR